MKKRFITSIISLLITQTSFAASDAQRKSPNKRVDSYTSFIKAIGFEAHYMMTSIQPMVFALSSMNHSAGNRLTMHGFGVGLNKGFKIGRRTSTTTTLRASLISDEGLLADASLIRKAQWINYQLVQQISWHFLNWRIDGAHFAPFVGVGINVAHFTDKFSGGAVDELNRWMDTGAMGELGIMLNDTNTNLYTFAKVATTISLSTRVEKSAESGSAVALSQNDLKLTGTVPVMLSLGFGMKF